MPACRPRPPCHPSLTMPDAANTPALLSRPGTVLYKALSSSPCTLYLPCKLLKYCWGGRTNPFNLRGKFAINYANTLKVVVLKTPAGEGDISLYLSGCIIEGRSSGAHVTQLHDFSSTLDCGEFKKQNNRKQRHEIRANNARCAGTADMAHIAISLYQCVA